MQENIWRNSTHIWSRTLFCQFERRLNHLNVGLIVELDMILINNYSNPRARLLINPSRDVKCGHVTRWTNLLMTTCFDTLRYLSYYLYNFEIKLPKREQHNANACFESVVIVFCCVIIRTTSNVCEVFAATRPSPSRPRSSDSGRLKLGRIN